MNFRGRAWGEEEDVNISDGFLSVVWSLSLYI